MLRPPLESVGEDLLDTVRTLATGLANMTIEGKLWIVQRGRIREYHAD